jgi:hypothetical protein
MSGSLRPLGIVAENDQGPIVTVYATVASCVSVFSIALRLLISFRRELQFQSDDFFVLAALVRVPSYCFYPLLTHVNRGHL